MAFFWVQSTRLGRGSFLVVGASHRDFPVWFQIERQPPEIGASCRRERQSETSIKGQMTMKRKLLVVAMAAVLAASGWWFAHSAWHTQESPTSSMGVGFPRPPGQELSTGVGNEVRNNPSQPGPMLRPPDPARRFTDFTPEQRVEFARKGHGPGG